MIKDRLGRSLVVRMTFPPAQVQRTSRDEMAAAPIDRTIARGHSGVRRFGAENAAAQLVIWGSTGLGELAGERPAPDLAIKLVNDGFARDHKRAKNITLPAGASWRNQAFGISAEPR
uniref:Uncharacterized protein n=1 Tax=Bosea sp. NBC_00436 TaxID=2969620 RepID=A0A9E8CS92_9HYPH